MTAPLGASDHADVIVVGAGVVGLAHAFIALEQGLSVRVLERDARAVGASIRNFGHISVTAQADDELSTGYTSRAGWMRAVAASGIWAREAGALVIARRDDELRLLEQFAGLRGRDQVTLLSRAEAASRLRGAADDADGILGGALFPADLRVDPRTAVADLAAWVDAQRGASVQWRHHVVGIDDGLVRTNRGDFAADRVVVCVGHDLDRLYPQIAESWQAERCWLQMALSAPVPGLDIDSAVLTGTSMLREDALAELPAAEELRRRVSDESPEFVDMAANIMFARRPDGTVLLGDTHAYGQVADPFLDEARYERVLGEISGILGRGLAIRQRWQGVHATSSRTKWITEDVDVRTRLVTVTSGIGMTMSFGIAAETFA